MIFFISSAAIRPTSDFIKYSSISSSVLSSISFLTIISLNPEVNDDALFLNPILNLSKISHYNLILIFLISETGPFI